MKFSPLKTFFNHPPSGYQPLDSAAARGGAKSTGSAKLNDRLQTDESTHVPTRKKGKWKKRWKGLKKLVSRTVKTKTDRGGAARRNDSLATQSVGVQETEPPRSRFRLLRRAARGKRAEVLPKEVKKAEPKKLELKDLRYTEGALPGITRLEQVREIINKQLTMPIAQIKDEIGTALTHEVLKSGGEAAAREVHEKVIVGGQNIADVAPDFLWKEEFTALYDTQAFTAQTEQDQTVIADLVKKVDAGTASPQDRASLSKKLHAAQANLAIAQTHVGQIFARHAERADKPELTLVLQTGIIGQGLSERLAVQHMAVADMISRYGDELPPVNIARPVDQINGQLRDAEGLSNALRLKQRQLVLEENPQIADAIEKVEQRCAELEKKFTAHQKAAQGRDDGSTPLQDKLVEIDPQPLDLGLDEALMPSQELLAQGRALATNQAAWPKIDNAFSFHVDGQAYNYQSTVEPGGAGVAQHFAHPYNGGVAATGQHQDIFHVPNLARSALQNEDSSVIFQANRHAAFNSSGVTPDFLKQLPPAELNDVIGTMYWDDSMATDTTRDFGAIAFSVANETDNSKLEPICQVIQKNAHKTMGREVIAATLIANEDKYHQALALANFNEQYDPNVDTEVITVPVNAISLMTPQPGKPRAESERALLADQLEGLRAASENGEPFKLPVRLSDGQLGFVPIKVELRQFNFGVEPAPRAWRGVSLERVPLPGRLARYVTGWGYSTQINDPALTQLLGERQTPFLEGAVGARLKELELQRSVIAGRRDAVQQLHDSKPALHSKSELDELNKQVSSIDYETRRIVQCAEQVKDIWRDGSFRSQGGEPHKLVARLSLLCHAIGESPSISDLNGLDRVNRCDADAKYLAATFDITGKLPPPDQDPDHAQRANFALHAGGEELRRYNSGLPG